MKFSGKRYLKHCSITLISNKRQGNLKAISSAKKLKKAKHVFVPKTINKNRNFPAIQPALRKS
jgi:hypothetical protein